MTSPLHQSITPSPRTLTRRSFLRATGHGLKPADKAVVSDIVDEVKARNYGFRSLVHEVVASQLFQSK